MPRSVSLVLLPAIIGALFRAAPAPAWTPATQVAIGQRAASLAPPDLGRQIERRKAEFRRGILTPFRDGDPDRHVRNEDGSGELDRVIAAEVGRAIQAIRRHQPFNDVVRQLGVVSHFLADANNPLNTSDADPRESGYFADYLYYVEAARPRFAVVFYGVDPGLRDGRGLSALLDRTFRRGRELYPLIGLEYRHLGSPAGIEPFDDRSTAFGVGAVSFSHAVTDIAVVLRYIWIAAGGIDERRHLPERAAGRLLLLPSASLGR